MSNPQVASLPIRLSVFAVNPKTHRPIQRMPVYAEIVWTEQSPPTGDRFNAVITETLTEIEPDCAIIPDCMHRVRKALAQLLESVLTVQGLQTLATQEELRTFNFIASVLREARAQAGGLRLNDIPATQLYDVLEDALRLVAEREGLPLMPSKENQEPRRTAYPLGMLATDHVGYLSFDLSPLPLPIREALRMAISLDAVTLGETDTPAEVHVYPFGLAALQMDALVQRRFTLDAVVMRLELDVDTLPPELANLGLLAMQTPGLTDWRLSPGSFAANPSSLIGADGCEAIIPANVAIHEYSFHQVVGFAPGEVELPLEASAQSHVRPGFVNEYRLSLVPVGHSLGQILYSFPLAPGESVNFAIVDWTHQDVGTRDEKTKVDERLVHDLRRERVIEESVKASIEEWQRGGSIMGGVAASGGSGAGASAGQSGGSGGGAALGAISGVSGGISAALGGAYSTSSGSRDIAANTIQKLSDNIAQAATSSRELFSTVVVQTSQAEREAIETRTVVNYNHSHALTMLYYEVLRHYRLVVSFVRRRPVLLTDRGPNLVTLRIPGIGKAYYEVNRELLVHNRSVIQAALLDPRLASRFDTLEAIMHRERVKSLTAPAPPAPDPNAPAGPLFKFLEFEVLSGGMVADINKDKQAIWIRCQIRTSAAPWTLKVNDGNPINPPGSFTHKEAWNAFTAIVPNGVMAWGLIDAFDISFQRVGGVDDMSVRHIKITAADTFGGRTILVDHPYVGGDLIMDADTTVTLVSNRPPSPPPPPGRPASEIEEEAQLLGLLDHIIHHQGHYERALRLGTAPADRARDLSGFVVSNGKSMLELVENRPLEVLGEFVAYTCVDPKFSQIIKEAYDGLKIEEPSPVERLVTYPTRGVFAEAKLGHCNASEEIDNTRFWDWQASPIPHLAPEIAPTQTVTPQVVKVEGLDASSLPSPLVSIISPPPAPDPHGMAAGLTALATANIFRDMSGRTEVADLLKKLTEASVQIANSAKDVAAGAKPSSSFQTAPQPQSGGAQVTQPSSGTPALPSGQGPSSAPSAPARTPEQRETDRLGNLGGALDIADRLPPEQARPIRKAVAKETILEKRVWNVVLTSEWLGETIKQPLDARFSGSLFFTTTPSEDGGLPLKPIQTNERAQWNDLLHNGTPIVVSIYVDEIKPLSSNLTIKVPGLAIDGLNLTAHDYNVPLRGVADDLLVSYKHSLPLEKAKVAAGAPLIQLQGTLLIAKKDIEVSFQLSAGGMLGGDLTGALAGVVDIKLTELTGTATLKAATQATVSGQAGIKAILEVLYIKGFQLSMV